MAVVRFLPHLNPATLPLTLHPGPTTMRPHLRVRLIPSAMADQGRAYELMVRSFFERVQKLW
jgi:hypothetical protein